MVVVEKSLEELHAKIDKLVDLLAKAVEKFDQVLNRKNTSSEIIERLDEVVDQNAQIADGIVALSEMVKDLYTVMNRQREPKMNFLESSEELRGPTIPPLTEKPRKKLFKK